MKRTLLAAVTVVACSCCPVQASIQLMGGSDYRIDTITDLDIGGVFYDATFVHGVSYDDFIASHPNNPVFISDAAAGDAIVAVRSTLNASAIDASEADHSTNWYFVPQYTSAGRVFSGMDGRSSINPLSYESLLASGSQFFVTDFSPGASIAWISFAPSQAAVPEPASLIVWASIAMATGLVLQRRSKHN